MRMRIGHQMWWWEAVPDQMVCGKGDDRMEWVQGRKELRKWRQ